MTNLIKITSDVEVDTDNDDDSTENNRVIGLS